MDGVIDGVAELFCEKLQAGVLERVARLGRELLEGRFNPTTGKPVRRQRMAPFLQTYKRCFKWMLEHHSRAAAAGRDRAALANLTEVLDEFQETIEPLLVQAEQDGDVRGRAAGREVMGAVERRWLQRFLAVTAPCLLSECKTRPSKLPKDAAPALKDPATVQQALRGLWACVVADGAAGSRTSAQACGGGEEEEQMIAQLGARFVPGKQ